MWTNKEMRVRFAALLQQVGLEPRNYSGRGMAGNRCVAVHLDSCTSAAYIGAMLALALVQHAYNEDLPICNANDAVDTLTGILENGTRGDNLGYGSVMYWPSTNWSEQVDFFGKPFEVSEEEVD